MSTETEVRTGVYEAMFLASQTAAASFGDLIEHINSLFERANADVISMKKWDERRLAYEIEKQKRGVYILAYFTCPTDMVPHLERDVVISDKLLRVLVTSADHLTEEEIAAFNDQDGLATETKLKADAEKSRRAKEARRFTSVHRSLLKWQSQQQKHLQPRHQPRKQLQKLAKKPLQKHQPRNNHISLMTRSGL